MAFSASAAAVPYTKGDVFASIGGGLVKEYTQTGTFVQTLDTTKGGFTTGSTFDAAGNFYVTAFSFNVVSKFNNNGGLVNSSWATGAGLNESIVFDKAGNAYIGNASAMTIRKVSATGATLTDFSTLQRTDWIDLAKDQVTLLYSDEGSTIRTLNTVTMVDTIFTTGSYGSLYAKRYLRDGGVIAASSTGNVYRWNAAGALVQTYAAGIGSVFALNLDANGTSFWTGATGGQKIEKINLTTGAIEQSWSTGSGMLFGLSVFGEIEAGGGGKVPEPRTLALLALGVLGLGLGSRRTRKA